MRKRSVEILGTTTTVASSRGRGGGQNGEAAYSHWTRVCPRFAGSARAIVPFFSSILRQRNLVPHELPPSKRYAIMLYAESKHKNSSSISGAPTTTSASTTQFRPAGPLTLQAPSTCHGGARSGLRAPASSTRCPPVEPYHPGSACVRSKRAPRRRA